MQTITTIGLDIAKSVFRVHGVDASGKVVILDSASARRRSSSLGVQGGFPTTGVISSPSPKARPLHLEA
jgi:hypothetical protein